MLDHRFKMLPDLVSDKLRVNLIWLCLLLKLLNLSQQVPILDFQSVDFLLPNLQPLLQKLRIDWVLNA
jgi:hypothetical protein